MPALVPGQPEKRISEFEPQKKVMCIIILCPMSCIMVPLSVDDDGGDMFIPGISMGLQYYSLVWLIIFLERR
ncbi:hypothetical protein PanWU01x14_354020 [Parasponia andersonii]|uniref:Transmembrane protein n=1 Tax=Parasponia andersonii TaxID=3476 RepID=A0A2P5A9U7_PARAD|nr:hypothetical protein PanWU01x14_354020 [Parasponia andersonii]